LVVGPGFKETELPGYPENAEAKILVSDYQGRNIRQLDFDVESNGLAIGGFRALDWFGDGSFYLLETPGVSCCCHIHVLSTHGADFDSILSTTFPHSREQA
jgi:hypothetical protein